MHGIFIVLYVITPPLVASLSMCKIRNTRLSLQAMDSNTDQINIVRKLVNSQFGLRDAAILDDSFSFKIRTKSLSKSQFLTTYNKDISALSRAAPDIDFRPYNFQVDEKNKNLVYFKVSPIGTITGPLSLNGNVYPPNNKKFELPIQLYTVTVAQGKVTSLCYACIDKTSGNTNGFEGLYGLLYALGEPPSELLTTPLATVIRKFFGRKLKQKIFKMTDPPFPQAVMFALATKVVDSSLDGSQPGLFSDDFQFSSGLRGPLSKTEFLRYSSTYNFKEALPDLKSTVYNFQVDAYKPNRVWLFLERSGTFLQNLKRDGNVVKEANGKSYKSSIEIVSISFDEQGLCCQATTGYVLDRQIGNTEGLGGNEGILQAIGAPLGFFETRAFSDILLPISDFFTNPFQIFLNKNVPNGANVESVKNSSVVSLIPSAKIAPVAAITSPVKQGKAKSKSFDNSPVVTSAVTTLPKSSNATSAVNLYRSVPVVSSRSSSNDMKIQSIKSVFKGSKQTQLTNIPVSSSLQVTPTSPGKISLNAAANRTNAKIKWTSIKK